MNLFSLIELVKLFVERCLQQNWKFCIAAHFINKNNWFLFHLFMKGRSTFDFSLLWMLAPTSSLKTIHSNSILLINGRKGRQGNSNQTFHFSFNAKRNEVWWNCFGGWVKAQRWLGARFIHKRKLIRLIDSLWSSL